MRKLFEIMLIVSMIFACGVHYSSQDIDWCNDMNCGNESHTLCRYLEESSSNHCSGIVNALDDQGKRKLLGLHNYVRNYISAGNVPGWPEAANMRQLTWDDECASSARRWAFQCTLGHDKCRRIPGFDVVGQNCGVEGLPNDYPDGLLGVFKSWLGQILITDVSNVDKFEFKTEIEGFAALVWAETYKIGCGLVKSISNGTGEISHIVVLVCNYAPGGNEPGQKMWEKGDACSKCPKGTSCNKKSTYRYLCANPDDPDDETPVSIEIPSREQNRPIVSRVLLAWSAILWPFTSMGANG